MNLCGGRVYNRVVAAECQQPGYQAGDCHHRQRSDSRPALLRFEREHHECEVAGCNEAVAQAMAEIEQDDGHGLTPALTDGVVTPRL